MLQLLDAHKCILSDLHNVLSGVVTGQESSYPGVNEDEFLTPFISGDLLPDHGDNKIVMIMPVLWSRKSIGSFSGSFSAESILEEENMSQ